MKNLYTVSPDLDDTAAEKAIPDYEKERNTFLTPKRGRIEKRKKKALEKKEARLYALKDKLEALSNRSASLPPDSPAQKKAKKEAVKIQRKIARIAKSSTASDTNANYTKLNKAYGNLFSFFRRKTKTIKSPVGISPKKASKLKKRAEDIKKKLELNQIIYDALPSDSKAKTTAEKKVGKLKRKLYDINEKLENTGANSLKAVPIERKYRRVKIAIIVISSVSVIAISTLAVTTFFFYDRTQRKLSEIDYLENRLYNTDYENRKLETKLEDLDGKTAEQNSELKKLKKENVRLKDEMAKKNSEINKLQPRANFLTRNIKIVEDDSYKTYHTYGCEYLDLSSFWAYNTEQVINNDKYTRCPYCN